MQVPEGFPEKPGIMAVEAVVARQLLVGKLFCKQIPVYEHAPPVQEHDGGYYGKEGQLKAAKSVQYGEHELPALPYLLPDCEEAAGRAEKRHGVAAVEYEEADPVDGRVHREDVLYAEVNEVMPEEHEEADDGPHAVKEAVANFHRLILVETSRQDKCPVIAGDCQAGLLISAVPGPPAPRRGTGMHPQSFPPGLKGPRQALFEGGFLSAGRPASSRPGLPLCRG